MPTAHPPRNHHSVCLRISALSTADVDGIMQDLDAVCTEVIRTRTLDADKYGERIAGLTDMQVFVAVVEILLESV